MRAKKDHIYCPREDNEGYKELVVFKAIWKWSTSIFWPDKQNMDKINCNNMNHSWKAETRAQ